MLEKIEKGLIIAVNLNPVKGSETGKIRPCIVVTNNYYNRVVPVIQVVPVTAWNEKKGKIRSNVTIEPTIENNLTKISVADCLQTRPIDYKHRIVKIIGKLSSQKINEIDDAIKIVFGLE
jgi:mRNA interferase MazF